MDTSRANKGRETVSLSPEIVEELIHFMEYHPAKRIDQNLRKLLLGFLQYDGAIEAGYLSDLLYDLEGLYRLLDAIQVSNEKSGFPSVRSSLRI